MTRKNNKQDMTIMEQLEQIKAKMCDEYCIYRSMAFSTNKDVDAAEEYLAGYCEECPMKNL